MSYIALLKQIWNSVYDPNVNTSEIIEMFFHKDYTQCINGVDMSRTEYIQHVLSQKQSMTIDTIDYKHFIENSQELFALYYPIGRNINNMPIEAEVIAYYRFEQQQILRIQGQLRLIKGSLADVDMVDTNNN